MPDLPGRVSSTTTTHSHQVSFDPFPAIFLITLTIFLWILTLSCTSVNFPQSAGKSEALNLLVNGSFEDGNEAWYSIENVNWTHFFLGEEPGKDGRVNHFAKTVASTDTPYKRLKISGAVQELILPIIPSTLQFRMRVNKSSQLDAAVYAQAVVIVWPKDPEKINRQMRYILYGVNEPPYRMANAAFVMHPSFLEEEGWRFYRFNLKEDFSKNHPDLTEIVKLRLLLESRFDKLPQGIEPKTLLLECDYDNVQLIP